MYSIKKAFSYHSNRGIFLDNFKQGQTFFRKKGQPFWHI